MRQEHQIICIDFTVIFVYEAVKFSAVATICGCKVFYILKMTWSNWSLFFWRNLSVQYICVSLESLQYSIKILPLTNRCLMLLIQTVIVIILIKKAHVKISMCTLWPTMCEMQQQIHFRVYCGEVSESKLKCVWVCVSEASFLTWDGRALSTKSSVSVSKLKMPISLSPAPHLISPFSSSHHLAYV